MNSLSRQFFLSEKQKPFLQVRILSEEPGTSWESVSKEVFDLPRGWYELSRISAQDRIEFTRDFWLDRIPYHPSAHPALFDFFERLDDVAVVLLQKKEGEPFEAELIYSLADNSSFFRGKPPAADGDLHFLKEELDVTLPRDYCSFLKIHNGFGKLSEMGLLESTDVADAKRRIIDSVIRSDKRIRAKENEVDPGSLIPFYESVGLFSFQCFYADWYPGSEMGNVYFSGIDYTISDVSYKKGWSENLAFVSFSDWLTHYLQGMNLCI